MTPKLLDTTRRSATSIDFEYGLRRKIVGQQEAVDAVTSIYQVYGAGLSQPDRPIGNILLLGPTGTGKTRLVESVSEVLYGHSKAMVKVNCAEFQHSHEIAKIIGSPPGYLGHRETQAMITQDALSKYHTEQTKLSLLLFDEIEKASDALWQLLLGIMDKATLTLGDNRTVDFSQCMVFLTSNLGGREISDMLVGSMGFAPIHTADSQEVKDKKIDATADFAAKKRFSPEFMNRLDKVIVFHPLRKEHLEKILAIELNRIQQRIIASEKGRFVFRTSQKAADYLIQEGTDPKYGARHLKRVLDQKVVAPLANLIATEQVNPGDVLTIELSDKNELLFYRERAMTA